MRRRLRVVKAISIAVPIALMLLVALDLLRRRI